MSEAGPVMSTSGETPREVPVDPADVVRAEIVTTRSELGETVERLAAKLDVRAHAKRRLDESSGAARRYRAQIAAAVVTTFVAAVAMQLRSRRRARRHT
jgi:nucleoid-associated protein YgaU